jgi:hypothetical protein
MHFFAKCSSELGIDGPLKKIVNVFLIGPKMVSCLEKGNAKTNTTFYEGSENTWAQEKVT